MLEEVFFLLFQDRFGSMAVMHQGLLRDAGIWDSAFFILQRTAGAGAFSSIITNNIPGGNIQLW